MARKKELSNKQVTKKADGSAARSAKRVSRAPKCTVALGGSAGGLEAFELFFRHMPLNSGLAFVVIPHLDPNHQGIMPELLQRNTQMKVCQVEDGMQVKRDCVYVIPSNSDMSINEGILHLSEPSAPRGQRLPIDSFFRSLAEDQGERSACVVLSGMGSDGTLGLKSIKERGGIALIQDPSSAKFDGMPRSALATGLVDVVGSPEVLAGKLLDLTCRARRVVDKEVTKEDKTLGGLQKVFSLLRAQTGHDFSFYKKSTVLRRVERRMAVHQIDRLEPYVRYLQQNLQEIDFLFKELLIGVTNFFRDPEAFDILIAKALPAMLRGKPKGEVLRIWAAGCSTGEEAYSVAMSLVECLEAQKKSGEVHMQIFATDMDKDAIDKARLGLYPANIAADVSEERLSRFFTPEDAFYRIRKDIREMVVFATHDIIMDPPFTKLDLLCCRNLLIYFNAEMQRKLIPLFHYALNPGGVMFLGSAETIGGFADLFTALDSKWKIFQRREVAFAYAGMVDLPSSLLAPGPEKAKPQGRAVQNLQATIPETAQRILLDHFSPPSVLINGNGDIIYISGRTGKFLELATGKAALNIYSLARQGLAIELTTAVRKALGTGKDVVMRGLQVQYNGGHITVDLVVKPLDQPEFMRGFFLIVFEEVPPHKTTTSRRRHSNQSIMVEEMEKEIKYLRETVQTVTEEMETSQEELKSTNEELQSTNEELQSSNEELTTSKEELQSLNEELITVNSELQVKVEELTNSHNDMRNLLNSIEIATIFLDNNLNVKRFTSQATKIFNLIQSDVGRPITHLVSNLKYETLERDVRSVLETLVYREEQVQSNDDRWYTLRIMPYRTSSNIIDGAVLTFVEITHLKELESELFHMAAVVEHASDAIISISLDRSVLTWNRGAERLFGYSAREMKGSPISTIVPADRMEELDSIMEQVLQGKRVEGVNTVRIAKGGKSVRVLINVSPIMEDTGRVVGTSTTCRANPAAENG